MKKNTVWLLGAAVLGLYLYNRSKKKQEMTKPAESQKVQLNPEQQKALQQISTQFKSQGFKLR